MVFFLIFSTVINSKVLAAPELPADHLDIIFLNVPHGEATLLTNEEEEHILINTGSKRSQKTLYKQLKNLNVTTIKTIILTNQTEEYTGNLFYFLDHYNVETVIKPDQIVDDAYKKVNVEKWKLDETIHLWDDVSFKALDKSKEGNISFLMQYRNESVLFLNDKDTSFEKEILEKVTDIDILKIADFGSGHSPSQTFLQHIDPFMSVIFQSEKHSINEALIERLHATWIDIYFLKQSGTVFVRLSKDDYEILTGNYYVRSWSPYNRNN